MGPPRGSTLKNAVPMARSNSCKIFPRFPRVFAGKQQIHRIVPSSAYFSTSPCKLCYALVYMLRFVVWVIIGFIKLWLRRCSDFLRCCILPGGPQFYYYYHLYSTPLSALVITANHSFHDVTPGPRKI